MQRLYNNNRDIEYLNFWINIIKRQLDLKDQQYELLYALQKKDLKNGGDLKGIKRKQTVITHNLVKAKLV